MNSKYFVSYLLGATNTGNDNGAIFYLERELKRPLMWIIYLIHLIEILMKHLIIDLDGKTTGKDTWQGPIGRDLTDMAKDTNNMKPFAKNIKPVPGDLEFFENLDESVLHNNDQKVLQRIGNN